MPWRWLHRVASVGNILRAAAWFWLFVGPSAVIYFLQQSWEYWWAANFAFKLLVFVGVFCILGSALAILIYFIFWPARNESGPRFWRWRWLPLQKLSWDFMSAFGSSSIGDGPVKFASFHPRFRINWGDGIKPKRCYLDFRTRGFQVLVRIEHGNPFLRAEQIPFIERVGFLWGAKWLSCSAPFRLPADENVDAEYCLSDKDAVTASQFFDKFGSFDFVFEYDDVVFRKRYSRNRLVSIFRHLLARHGTWSH